MAEVGVIPAKKFTDLQPKDGDTILVCLHAVQGSPKDSWRWFRLKEFGAPTQVVRHTVDCAQSQGRGKCNCVPEMLDAHFLCICDDCWSEYHDHPMKAARAHRIWIGDEPAVFEDQPN